MNKITDKLRIIMFFCLQPIISISSLKKKKVFASGIIKNCCIKNSFFVSLFFITL